MESTGLTKGIWTDSDDDSDEEEEEVDDAEEEEVRYDVYFKSQNLGRG